MARGIFSKWQPEYAEHNLITFPVGKDKKPAIKHWQRLGFKGSAQLAEKFSDVRHLRFCARATFWHHSAGHRQ
jgi:hypothetical protein